MVGAFKLHSTEFDFLKVIADGNLQLAEDALLLLEWTKKTGVMGRARKGEVPYGSPGFRVYTGLYALADALFQQAEAQDRKVFDLYDALIAEWPEKSIEVPHRFMACYNAWRARVQYVPSPTQATVDLTAHRRVSDFVKSCS